MSGGSQHNPNGRQSQLGSGWSPLQLQMANLLARAPPVHLASDRGVTWHTPTPPPHMYHVPAPSPPDPLQAMKTAGNSVFRHTATPPEMFRHTPTPPDKHMHRHTPSPGDVKSGAALPPADLFQHLGPARDKHVRPEDFLAYARGGVDLSIGSRSNGSPNPSSPSNPRTSLSVRDAPTINSLIARAQPRHPHARVDALLERLAPSPVSPHSVIVHSRAAPTPSPPSSNDDSADSFGAPPGSKRKRKPERTVRLPSTLSAPPTHHSPTTTTQEPQPPNPPQENGETNTNGAEQTNNPSPPPERRKTRSGSAETIDDIAAMIACTAQKPEQEKPEEPVEAPVTIDKLKSVLASPEPSKPEETPVVEEPPKQDIVETAAAPKRRSARTSNSESTNVPVESPSEAKPAEADVSSEARSAEPTAASFVEVENQLEKMFAGIEEPTEDVDKTPVKKRRKSAPGKGEKKASRRRVSVGDEPRRKGMKKKAGGKGKKKEAIVKDAYAYDSGSNASSGRSRGPYIQIRGPRDSPLSVSVINASTGEEEGDVTAGRRKGDEYRNGLRTRGLHASTLGLRYDAVTADATWLCAFCARGPHAAGLGDLFGPYALHTDCEEYKALDEATRQRYDSAPNSTEVWFHESCGVWAPGLLAAGARLWGLPAAVWAARAETCVLCRRPGATVVCGARGCPARSHLPCATQNNWRLDHEEFRSHCPLHENSARGRHIRLVGGDSAQIIPLVT